MIEEKEIEKIKETVEEFLKKMTITGFSVELTWSSKESQGREFEGILGLHSTGSGQIGLGQAGQEKIDIVDVDITLEEPQILIGQNGQTLFELQRILKIMLNKKLSRLRQESSIDSLLGQNNFYVKLDINGYKKKKIEYLKKLAKDLANEVLLTKEKKILPPMPAYERKIIHMELAGRQDIITESQGDGFDRCVVIKPR